MHRRKIDEACRKETKWRGMKTNKGERYKLLDLGANETKNAIKNNGWPTFKGQDSNVRRIVVIDIKKSSCMW